MREVSIDNIKKAIESMKDSADAAQNALDDFLAQDLTQENASLKSSLETVRAQLDEAKDEYEDLNLRYEQLRKNFALEMAAKRSAVTRASRRKIEEYYRTGLEKEHAKINAFEAEMQNRIAGVAAEIRTLSEAQQTELKNELEQLSKRTQEHVRQARQSVSAAWDDALSGHDRNLSGIDNAPVESEAFSAIRKFFDWESFFGLRIISVIGVILVLIGAFTFGRYLYLQIPAIFQCATIYALGILLLIIGEVLYRKWRGVFGTALTSGGAGVLFLATALGYMTMDVLPALAALIICTVIAVVVFLLAMRYNAQLVAVLALLGGYLPVFAAENDMAVYCAVYFMMFGLFVLAVATRKTWRVTRFFGLAASIISEIELLSMGDTIGQLSAIGAAVIVGYAAYLLIPVIGASMTKTRIRASDIALLAINIAVRFIFVTVWWEDFYYAVSHRTGFDIMYQNGTWIVPLLFFVSCIAMARLCRQDKTAASGGEVCAGGKGSLRALFFITSVAFAAFFVFFLLDYTWYSTGILVQATGLLLYGLKKDLRRFRIAGIVLGSVCIFAFLSNNLAFNEKPEFVIQYGLLTVSLMLVAVSTLRRKRHVMLDVFRCIAALNLWWFIVYLLNVPVYNLLRDNFAAPVYPSLALSLEEGLPEDMYLHQIHIERFIGLSSVIAGLLLGLILPRIRRCYNRGFHAAAVITAACATLWLLAYNTNNMVPYSSAGVAGVFVFALLITVNIVCVVWVYDILNLACRANKLRTAWYPLLLSGWGLILLTQLMAVQMQLRASSLILTLLFAVTALGWVIYGFLRRNAQTRISGLAMSFVCILKLFLVDLYSLTSGWRIVSYFIGGVILLAISFTYQYFSKKLKESAPAPVLEYEPVPVPAVAPPAPPPPVAAPLFCASCGAQCAPGDKFCGKCGNVL